MLIYPVVLLQAVFLCNVAVDAKKPVKYNQTNPSPKFDNPGFIRDRFKEPSKPQMPDSWIHRDRLPFNQAWMDYCDPRHCNSYTKTACGLNRKSMRFKWFQSECHLIINNQCATFRGALKYDIVDTKFCEQYVMHLRDGCPHVCDNTMSLICGVSTVKNQAVLFKNRCALERANCRNYIETYEEVHMDVCDYYLRHG